MTSSLCLIRQSLFEENYGSPALLKVPIYFTELVSVIFIWKAVLNIQNTYRDPILSIFDVTISQQQLLLIIKYSKFVRRTILNICAC